MRFTRIVALFLTLAVPCAAYAQQSKKPRRHSRTTAAPQPPTLDQEAVALAEKDFLEPWTQVGDSWFTWWRGKTFSAFIQIRGVTHKVKPESLSEAETLNGLQWKGEVRFFSRIYREYYQIIGEPQAPQWSDWRDGEPAPGGEWLLLPSYRLTKKNGQWTIDSSAGGDKDRLTKPSEEQIKKILPQ